MRVRVCPDRPSLARAAAGEFVATLSGGSRAKPQRVLLSGGKTPEPMYRALAAAPMRSRLDWGTIECFFADERPVPPDHPDSNYGLARRALFEPLGSDAPRAYRMRGEAADLAMAARRYESEMRERFGVPPPAVPAFDLALLGLGADGHVASLFPGAAPSETPTRLVEAIYVDTLHVTRMTVTYPVLNAARHVVFVVAGHEKAEALLRTLAPEPGKEPTPAALVVPSEGDVLWLVDRDAARGLPSNRGIPIEEARS